MEPQRVSMDGGQRRAAPGRPVGPACETRGPLRQRSQLPASGLDGDQLVTTDDQQWAGLIEHVTATDPRAVGRQPLRQQFEATGARRVEAVQRATGRHGLTRVGRRTVRQLPGFGDRDTRALGFGGTSSGSPSASSAGSDRSVGPAGAGTWRFPSPLGITA